MNHQSAEKAYRAKPNIAALGLAFPAANTIAGLANAISGEEGLPAWPRGAFRLQLRSHILFIVFISSIHLGHQGRD